MIEEEYRELYQEYLETKLDHLDDCICHISLAIDELKNYQEFSMLASDLKIILEYAKRLKNQVEDDKTLTFYITQL